MPLIFYGIKPKKDGQGYPFVPIQAKNVGRKHCFLPHISFLSTGPLFFAKYTHCISGWSMCPCFTGRVSPPAGGGDGAPARRGRARGGLAPSCGSPPPGDVRGCPRPQTNFIHILWKNLICDNVAAV